jgi:hypothetical protein
MRQQKHGLQHRVLTRCAKQMLQAAAEAIII